MNILVLGGTGAMGGYLVNNLSQLPNNKIFVTSRKEHTTSLDNISYIKGNAHDIVFISSVLKQQNWDVIIDFMIYNTEEFKQRVNLLLTSCKQYIFLSSARVFADSRNPITEETPRLLDVCKDNEYLKTDEYAISKARQENYLLENNNKNWTIIRPYITYSENRLQLGIFEKEAWLFRALYGKSIVFPHRIENSYTTLTRGIDVANFIISVIGKEKAFQESFNVVTNKSLKWADVLDVYKKEIKDVLDKTISVHYVDDKELEVLRTKDRLYQFYYDRLYNRVFDNTKIKQYINVDDFCSPIEGLSSCIRNFLLNPNFAYIDWKEEAKKDRITKDWFSFLEIKNIKYILKYSFYRIGL